ncbi:MAG: DUF433 domain-containing protein [Ignavibacteriales bacterium]|nr:DUF433 domain-containing protein [Ignavibacteriales bacterium]
MFKRITIDPKMCDGKAAIRGLRITVDFVLKLLADGYTPNEVVKEYPELTKEDVLEAVRYGAWLASDKTLAVA